jgi:hypothetical protein
MKLPRDVSANQLIKALSVLGYSIHPQSQPNQGGHLARILQNIARHHNVTVEGLLSQLDL